MWPIPSPAESKSPEKPSLQTFEATIALDVYTLAGVFSLLPGDLLVISGRDILAFRPRNFTRLTSPI